MIGDVIFFKKDSSFISRAIAFMTKSDYSHVGLIVAHDELTNTVTIIESDRFVNTRENTFKLEDRHVVYTTGEKPKEQVDLIMKFARKSVGVSYDYLQILGLFISLIFKGERFFNSANKYICSELIDLAYFKAGVPRKNFEDIGNVTPEELLYVYELKTREKEV